MKKLFQLLKQIDNKGYKAYKSLQGQYKFRDFDLMIDYVQGDPFATPSKLRVVIPQTIRPIKPNYLQSNERKIAVEDVIARSVGKAMMKQHVIIKGSGKSGLILFDNPGQEILQRSAVQIDDQKITICMSVGLPANGRRINGREAEKLFSIAVPSIIKDSVLSLTDEQITDALILADQQVAIRHEMKKNNWISFIANGSILPRESGVSNLPLKQAVPFKSPIENEVSITIPHQAEPIKGMAIEKGITLIVGGGFHGKSTLLQAIERGVYYHVKGDGREFVLTDPDAVKIRAEDGRQITGVNISPFINDLPHGQDTSFFTTENASGSTSQAANVIEALEIGATTLLIDEDTSATNFMIRDHRMQQLVKKEKEPITPFIDKITQLRDEFAVSTILVMGGSGDYFAVADKVIMMDEYAPVDVTNEANAIMEKEPLEREKSIEEAFGQVTQRCFHQQTLQTTNGRRSKTQAKGLHKIIMGKTNISFEYTEQLVDDSQTRMIAEVIQYLDRTKALKDKTLSDILIEIEKQFEKKGLAFFTVYKEQHPGDLAKPRKYEIAAVLNRMRTASVIKK
ncbi:ABC-ATPase domain-containing protein [Oceanobacillus bengalensis]|uniref:ATPase n=1 Tax=Oceanobacillus bengalensis TaxID=1435466 RepID=A0A494Z827_9BACI|nr:ABC-ATPase domain-containing protein [Oceanobacillus bengalensis]RKQ18745.1 ATPase [Oceanobacillus bengalensis]